MQRDCIIIAAINGFTVLVRTLNKFSHTTNPTLCALIAHASLSQQTRLFRASLSAKTYAEKCNTPN
ncbi:hypothetical protein HCH_01276 [Hahella chejuensis KCTC 2396]|uniref:Uncharacterized protein n=1 Tax=Hahella chejuensis (strain KCTC 2396) TaxID=349521 RepID=Q2SMI0_HAHCH|nr:hypothetical protein HCH_01276 [Hahella chejuensis KCTC 2396]